MSKNAVCHIKERAGIGSGQEQGAELNDGPIGPCVNRRLEKNCIMNSISFIPQPLLLLLLLLLSSSSSSLAPFCRVIYTYFPETNHVPREYIVAAILALLFMVPISPVPALALLYFLH
jgi:hypothetical protein